jgi:hypothetical protein
VRFDPEAERRQTINMHYSRLTPRPTTRYKYLATRWRNPSAKGTLRLLTAYAKKGRATMVSTLAEGAMRADTELAKTWA